MASIRSATDSLVEVNVPTSQEWMACTCAVLGSIVIGTSGLLPILIFPTQQKFSDTKDGAGKARKSLNRHLSFAVGGLLGDICLHLLPEVYARDHQRNGLALICGVVCFLVLERILQSSADKNRKSAVVGYLNLVANCVDNFVHGLAVAASFLASLKLGLVTVVAILIHEIPHEIGDFAILMKSGFSRWEAGKAQMFTASIGLLGALVALSVKMDQESAESSTSFMLSFSAGGFLHVAMVSIMADLVKETEPREAAIHLLLMMVGILVMTLVSLI